MVIYSHSKISLFEQCPLKFKFKYIEKIPPEIKQTIESFFGNIIHESLEKFYKNILEGKKPQLDDLLRIYCELWNKNFSDEIKFINGFNDKDYYFNKGIKILIDYYNSNFPFLDNTIALEKRILIKLDDKGNYFLEGYIDRLVYEPSENKIEIHDYKTTNFLKTEEELIKDRQLAIYTLGIKENFLEIKNLNQIKEIFLIWHFLSFNKKIILKKTLEDLPQFKEEILKLIFQIESTTDFKPNISPNCKWCEFKNYCQSFRENKI